MRQGHGANLRALMFVLAFMISAVILTCVTILLPARRWARAAGAKPPRGAVVYFIAIGLGFMLVEMGMMQQLSIFLGHPIYSLVVVLTGLILFTGFGSFVSDRLKSSSSLVARTPAIITAVVVVLYSLAVIPVIHRFIAGVMWQRALISLLLVAPCGCFMGFCFPLGLRWMGVLRQEKNLPWMWALNGAASTLGSFVAILVSMSTSITACVVLGASLYLLAALFLPQRAEKSAEESMPPRSVPVTSA